MNDRMQRTDAPSGHDRTGGERGADLPEQDGIGRSIALHLLPGVAIAALFYATAPLIMRLGYPAIAAGVLASAVGILGLELGWLLREGRRRTGRWSIAGALAWRPGKFTWRKWLLVFALLLWQIAMAFVVGAFKPAIVENLFSWMPTWAITPLPTNIGDTASSTVLLTTAAALFLFNGIIGPLGEELYFRGYLLPRLSRLGAWAPLINVALFSLYHFWTPWDLVTRIVLLLPMAYATWKTRDVRIAIGAHVGINTLSFFLSSAGILLGN